MYFVYGTITTSVLQVGIANSVILFMFNAMSPVALELAAEITFPASEETAAAYVGAPRGPLHVGCSTIAEGCSKIAAHGGRSTGFALR